MSTRTRYAVAAGAFYAVLLGALFAGQVAVWMLTTGTPLWPTVREVVTGYALGASAVVVGAVLAAVAYRVAKGWRR
jgi:hypothetical protein